MKQFSELGIGNNEPERKGLVGDRIKTERVLDKKITVLHFEIKGSKFEGRCLHLQIEYNEDKRVIFTSSKGLISQLENADPSICPFTTVIRKQEDETYKFT